MKRWKQAAALTLALVLTAALAGCGKQANKATIRTVLPTAATLDPAMVTDEAGMMIVSHLYENLMKLSGGDQIKAVGGMARSYSVQDNADGSQICTFLLRDNADWSDGSPVTAGDFVYAWRRLVDPATASPHAALLRMVSGYEDARESGDMTKLKVTAKDDATLVVELSYPCAFFLSSVCTHPATMPVKQSAAESGNWPNALSALVTNGPYQAAAWQGKLLTVVKNTEYYDARRLLPDVLTFSFEDDAATRRELWESGEADLALAIDEGEGLQVKESPEVTVLALNQLSASMQISSFRKALAAVIDRSALVEGDMLRVSAVGLVPVGIRNSRGGDYRESCTALTADDPTQFEERQEAALQELHSLAYVPEDLPVFTLAYENTPALAEAARAIRNAWSGKLELELVLTPVAPEELDSTLQTGEYTAALYTVRGDCSDPSEFLDLWQAGQAANYANYYSNAYNILIRSARNSSSAEARDAFLEAAEQLLVEENGYVIPLWESRSGYLASPALQGISYDSFGGLRLLTASVTAEK